MISKIVIPLDGSPVAEQVLPYVTQIAAVTGAKVVLIPAPMKAALRHASEAKVPVTLK